MGGLTAVLLPEANVRAWMVTWLGVVGTFQAGLERSAVGAAHHLAVDRQVHAVHQGIVLCVHTGSEGLPSMLGNSRVRTAPAAAMEPVTGCQLSGADAGRRYEQPCRRTIGPSEPQLPRGRWRQVQRCAGGDGLHGGQAKGQRARQKKLPVIRSRRSESTSVRATLPQIRCRTCYTSCEPRIVESPRIAGSGGMVICRRGSSPGRAGRC